MFDIAFAELVIVAIVALIVIGPEKLPKVARTLGSLAGRMQRYVATVKQDIERELELDELKRLQQDFRQGSIQVRQEIENSIHAAGSDVKKVTDELASEPTETEEPRLSNDRDAKS